MPSTVPRKNNVKNTFSLEEMVHWVLESDDDESLVNLLNQEVR